MKYCGDQSTVYKVDMLSVRSVTYLTSTHFIKSNESQSLSEHCRRKVALGKRQRNGDSGADELGQKGK